MHVKAPAKINLHLRVMGRRSDGFHQIETLLQTIDIADDLCALVAPPDVLERRVHPAGVLPTDDDNLVMRAANALRQHAGTKVGALIRRKPVMPNMPCRKCAA